MLIRLASYQLFKSVLKTVENALKTVKSALKTVKSVLKTVKSEVHKMIDKDCPCTSDCPDRPNCRGCKRGNEYRAKKIQESRQKQAENEFNGYLFGKYITRQHKSMKFKKGRLK